MTEMRQRGQHRASIRRGSSPNSRCSQFAWRRMLARQIRRQRPGSQPGTSPKLLPRHAHPRRASEAPVIGRPSRSTIGQTAPRERPGDQGDGVVNGVVRHTRHCVGACSRHTSAAKPRVGDGQPARPMLGCSRARRASTRPRTRYWCQGSDHLVNVPRFWSGQSPVEGHRLSRHSSRHAGSRIEGNEK